MIKIKANKKKIDLRRAELCMSSSDLQRESGLPRGTYLGVICGKSVRPETIGRVAKALKMDVSELIDEEV